MKKSLQELVHRTGGRGTIYAGNGADYVDGGLGDDVMAGEAGLDILNGGAACAVLFERNKCEAANDAEGRMRAWTIKP